MIWRIQISTRFKESRQEIKAWYFDELIAAHELIEALDEAEQDARDRAEDEAERRKQQS